MTPAAVHVIHLEALALFISVVASGICYLAESLVDRHLTRAEKERDK